MACHEVWCHALECIEHCEQLMKRGKYNPKTGRPALISSKASELLFFQINGPHGRRQFNKRWEAAIKKYMAKEKKLKRKEKFEDGEQLSPTV